MQSIVYLVDSKGDKRKLRIIPKKDEKTLDIDTSIWHTHSCQAHKISTGATITMTIDFSLIHDDHIIEEREAILREENEREAAETVTVGGVTITKTAYDSCVDSDGYTDYEHLDYLLECAAREERYAREEREERENAPVCVGSCDGSVYCEDCFCVVCERRVALKGKACCVPCQDDEDAYVARIAFGKTFGIENLDARMFSEMELESDDDHFDYELLTAPPQQWADANGRIWASEV